MKKGIKSILLFAIKLFARVISIVWPYSISQRFRVFKLKIHTLWILGEFKKIDEDTFIDYPIFLRGGKYICIGKRVGLGKRGILTAWDKYKGEFFHPEINIGDYTSIGEDFHITAINKIVIGNNVLMGKKITITDNSHGKTDDDVISLPPIERPLYSKGPVIIEDGVWIGDKVTILPNVSIGRNAIIGANALVTKNVPANCVVGGVPAIVIKKIR